MSELDDPDFEIQVGTLKIDGAGDATQTIGIRRLEIHPGKKNQKRMRPENKTKMISLDFSKSSKRNHLIFEKY